MSEQAKNKQVKLEIMMSPLLINFHL